jgi:UDP-glucose 4-epimerase
MPVVEHLGIDPMSPYGRTKFFIEQILQDLVKTNLWQIMVLRYFNVAGAHSSGLLGEEASDFPSNIVPNILGVLNQRYPFLSVYGGDYPTVDGTAIRDYIHIQDLVEAHIAAIAHLGWKPFDIFNLGSGKGYSILEMVKQFESITQKSIPYRIFKRRPGDVAQSIANIDKAKVYLAWEPKRSIEDICESAWRFRLEY